MNSCRGRSYLLRVLVFCPIVAVLTQGAGLRSASAVLPDGLAKVVSDLVAKSNETRGLSQLAAASIDLQTLLLAVPAEPELVQGGARFEQECVSYPEVAASLSPNPCARVQQALALYRANTESDKAGVLRELRASLAAAAARSVEDLIDRSLSARCSEAKGILNPIASGQSSTALSSAYAADAASFDKEFRVPVDQATQRLLAAGCDIADQVPAAMGKIYGAMSSENSLAVLQRMRDQVRRTAEAANAAQVLLGGLSDVAGLVEDLASAGMNSNEVLQGVSDRMQLFRSERQAWEGSAGMTWGGLAGLSAGALMMGGASLAPTDSQQKVQVSGMVAAGVGGLLAIAGQLWKQIGGLKPVRELADRVASNRVLGLSVQKMTQSTRAEKQKFLDRWAQLCTSGGPSPAPPDCPTRESAKRSIVDVQTKLLAAVAKSTDFADAIAKAAGTANAARRPLRADEANSLREQRESWAAACDTAFKDYAKARQGVETTFAIAEAIVAGDFGVALALGDAARELRDLLGDYCVPKSDPFCQLPSSNPQVALVVMELDTVKSLSELGAAAWKLTGTLSKQGGDVDKKLTSFKAQMMGLAGSEILKLRDIPAEVSGP